MSFLLSDRHRLRWLSGVGLCLLTTVFVLPCRASTEDPWHSMQDLFPSETRKLEGQPSTDTPLADPWLELQEYFIPFTEQQERQALTNEKRALAIAGKLHRRLYPFRAFIASAASRFNIPPEIIGAVIMVESSGNPRATAKTSSAKGLMQTINSTFTMARNGLQREGIQVADSPYNIQAAIMTGSWYLSRMYDQAVRDGRLEKGERGSILAWKKPTEYYYAGPRHGKKSDDVVITYAGGRRVVIDKPAYSEKVLRWATIMAGSRQPSIR